MSRPALYRWLEKPWVYALSQALLAPGAGRLESRHLDPLYKTARGVVLDVGCGPESKTPIAEGLLVGLDVNPDYVSSFAGAVETDPERVRQPTAGRTRLGYVGSADRLPFGNEVFDEVRCRGLLHHLAPDVALLAVQEMWRCLRPGGRLILMDNVWPKSRLTRPIAWLIRKYDRGEFIRTEADLAALVRAGSTERCEYFRFTYTYNGLEGLCLTACK